MRLDPEDNSVLLTTPEMAALARSANGDLGELAVIPATLPSAEEIRAALDGLERLDLSDRNRLLASAAALARPSQVIKLHYSIADASISRAFIAWPPAGGDSLALLAETKEGTRLATRLPEEVKLLLGRVLASEVPIARANFRLALSSSAVLVLLAVSEQFRYARYHSLLAHTAPWESFTPTDLTDRLREASVEDYRWPLAFFAKLLPSDGVAGITDAQAAMALGELSAAGLLAAGEVDDGDGGPVIYRLTEEGEILCDALYHEVSKVGMRISAAAPEGGIGNESVLLVRGNGELWLFGVTGGSGIVASLDSEGLDRLLDGLLESSTAKPSPAAATTSTAGAGEQAVVMAATAAVGEATAETAAAAAVQELCASCGAPAMPGARFCGSCGTPVPVAAPAPPAPRAPDTCPRCGTKPDAGGRFCGACGAPL